jgi:hypothetical protein
LVLAAAAPMRYASGVRADDIVLLGLSLLAVALGVLVALLTLRALRQLWCELGPPAAPPGRGTGRRGGGATLARWWRGGQPRRRRCRRGRGWPTLPFVLAVLLPLPIDDAAGRAAAKQPAPRRKRRPARR